jgi:hypothetical protein
MFKLGDFRTVHPVDESKMSDKGTDLYIASEMFSSSDIVSTSTDIFSFGILRAERRSAWRRKPLRVLGGARAGCKRNAAAGPCLRGDREMALRHFALVE